MLKYSKETENRISRLEVEYWKKAIISNFKVGVEIETNLAEGTDDNAIDCLQQRLSQTDSINNFGKFGVFQVKYDGSLDNGVEVVTVGRRNEFVSMYNQYRYIINKIKSYKPFINGRAGLHNHILLSYNNDTNTLERNLPGVIFKNYMQLFKKYCRELVFLTSTMVVPSQIDSDFKTITRYNYYSDWNKLVKTTVLNRNLIDYRSEMSGTRYRFINFSHLVVDENEVKKMHLELRFPDGSLFPAQIASQGFLYEAMLLKAIELSEFGVINVTETDEEWEEIKEDIKNLRNDDGDTYRMSSSVSDTFIDKLSKLTVKMIKNFKPQIAKLDENVYKMLLSLANKPISLRLYEHLKEKRISYLSSDEFVSLYDVINKDLHKEMQTIYNFKSDLYNDITKSIILNEFTNVKSLDEWSEKLSLKIDVDKEEITNEIKRISQYRKIMFSSELGTLYFK